MIQNQNYPSKISISTINDIVLVQKLYLEDELTFLCVTGTAGYV
jgi:hypothetical protein